MQAACRLSIVTGALVVTAYPALAQSNEEPLQPDEGRLILDLDHSPSNPEPDPLLVQQCEEEADAARIAGEIVVCRSLGEVTDGAWDKADFERRYAEATQGVKTPDVDESGIRLPGEGSLIAITVTTKLGDPPPPALMIDIEALPEPPEGSDAEQIANGLPALGD